MPNNLPQASFEQVAKNPIVYALMIVGLMVGLFANNWIGASNKVNDNCQNENTRLRTENEDKDKRLLDLYNALLIKNRIIEKTDSVTRVKVGVPAKQIVKDQQ